MTSSLEDMCTAKCSDDSVFYEGFVSSVPDGNIYLQYLTKVSTPLTFRQSIKYIFSSDNTIEMKLGYSLE